MAEEGVEWQAFAPNIQKSRVVNHLTESLEIEETRSVMVEAARLVRGKISPLTSLNINDFSGIIFPGGVGA